LNEGESNKLIKHGANKCSVTVTVDNNVIERAWSSSSNTYKLNGELFKSFRTSVPGDIAKLVNMAPISIQSRRDLPFMVYYRGSETAEQFSTMLDLNEIQLVTTNTNRYVKDTKTKLDNRKAELNEVQAKLESYTGLDEAIEKLKTIQDLAAKIEQRHKTIDILQKLQNSEYKTRVIMAKTEQYVDAEYDLRELEKTSNVIAERIYLMQRVSVFSEQYKAAKMKAERLAEVDKFTPMLAVISELREEFASAKARYNKVWDLQTDFKREYGIAKNIKTKLATLTKELNAYKGTICPTCGQIIGEI
jgi:hypothetical protein